MAVITKRKNNLKSKSSMKTKKSSKSKSNSKTRKQFKNIRKNGMGTRKMMGGAKSAKSAMKGLWRKIKSKNPFKKNKLKEPQNVKEITEAPKNPYVTIKPQNVKEITEAPKNPYVTIKPQNENYYNVKSSQQNPRKEKEIFNVLKANTTGKRATNREESEKQLPTSLELAKRVLATQKKKMETPLGQAIRKRQGNLAPPLPPPRNRPLN
jgi:hypothetical protein